MLNSAGSLYDDTLLVYAADRMLDTSGLDTELPDALKVRIYSLLFVGDFQADHL